MSAIGWVTLEQADAYFATRLGAGAHWTETAEKEAALRTAHHDLVSCGLFAFPDEDEPPETLRVAQCEQALFLLANPDLEARQAIQAQGVVAAGIVQESYAGSGGHGPVVAPRAAAMLREYQTVNTASFDVVR